MSERFNQLRVQLRDAVTGMEQLAQQAEESAASQKRAYDQARAAEDVPGEMLTAALGVRNDMIDCGQCSFDPFAICEFHARQIMGVLEKMSHE